MKHTLVYLNPLAGSGRSREVWKRLRAQIPALKTARLICNADRSEALTELREALQETAGLSRLLVIGGDGTLHRVAHEILIRGLGDQVPVGLIPAGTGSDLARGLRLPKNPKAASRRALEGEATPIDVLRVEASDGRVRFCVNVASAGISGVVDEAVNAQAHRSALVYVRETLKAAAGFRSVACRLTVDGEPFFQGEAFLVAMANSRYFGRGMKIAPQADPKDGKADIVVVGPIPRWQLPARIAQVFLGKHLNARPVRWRRGRSMELSLPAGAPALDLDGESFDARDVSFEVLPSALRVFL